MMEEIGQNNKKNSLFFHDGFSYHQDKRCKETYRCSLRKKASCHGTLIGTKENSTTKYVCKTMHNHEPKPHAFQIQKLKTEMRSLCRTTLRTSKQIFDDVCRMDPDTAKSLSFVSMKSILNRERAMLRPAVPKTIAALSNLIQNFEPLKNIYKGSVTADEGKMALIFSTTELLNALAATSEILVDGTFSVVPRFPPLIQLYSVHIRYLNTVITFANATVSHNNIPGILTLASMRSVLTREIKKHRQDVPTTITALDGFLRDYGPLQEMYKGSIITEEGSTSLLFSTSVLLKALETASQIFVGCQNWVLATEPPMSHMMSVHIEDQYTGIAAAFILCETLSEATHYAVWNKILDLAPGMRNSLETVISVVISKLFPTAKIYGNWSSYRQALWKEWSSLELSAASRDLLAMTLSMPLAPCDFFDESLKIMQDRADAMARDQSAVLQFMAYMRTVWLPIATKLSVYGCPVRISNTLESFQRTAVAKITANNNLQDFLGQWKKLINDQVVAIDRLRVNGRVTNGHTRINRERIEKISRLQQDLVKNRLPINDYLNAFNLLYVGHEQNPITISQDVKSDLVSYTDLLAKSASTDRENNTNVQRRNDMQRPEGHSEVDEATVPLIDVPVADRVTERPSTTADKNRTRSLSESSADVDSEMDHDQAYPLGLHAIATAACKTQKYRLMKSKEDEGSTAKQKYTNFSLLKKQNRFVWPQYILCATIVFYLLLNLSWFKSMTTDYIRLMASVSSAERIIIPATREFVDQSVASDAVVIFSKSYCPYCKMTKESILGEMTGARTVPRVFVMGECIGDGTDVKKLYESGELEMKF